ncbi:hypothetical protein H0G86_010147 [Trichoderma simmonsii]|uniref:Nephrocystin 3-like N-terminal domain-containing protein n=1 Tax=Trichoderma simmonsii TaxID=1491479 RepID=A0A8G0LIY3_9HYPO|nr:hypothetical protein H0G86_010147 [Trichoderma simmonsii]
MDPISALGIAAAAFQFLDVGGKLFCKASEKYEQIQQKIPDDANLLEEIEEFRKLFDDLSFQNTWIREVFAKVMLSEPPTSTQIQLLQLSSQCTSLSNEFERIKSQMKPPNNRKMNTEIHFREHISIGPHVPEKDCRECQQKRDEKNAEFQKNKEDIEGIKRKLEALKRNTIDLIFTSLWDDSKRTKQWELHFNNQLGKLLELLDNDKNLTMNTQLKTIYPTYQKTFAQDRSRGIGKSKDYLSKSGSIMADEEVARLRNALQPLIQPGKGRVSLKQLAEGIIKYFKVDSGVMNAIRGELVSILWKYDWKLDDSMVSAKIDTTVVAHAIAAGIQFSEDQTREDDIPQAFKGTYSWIFQEEPMTMNGTPMWCSFPAWLRDDYQKVYWITGKPGSGKSTIMKLISQHKDLRDMISWSAGSLRLVVVKHYAWLAGTTLQKSLEGLKRTVISQALEQYPDLAPVLTPRRWGFCQILESISGLPTWETWEIEESFELLLSMCGETIRLALFIDGLDEFDTPIADVIEFIRHITTRCHSGLKVCTSSRPRPEFEDEFNEGPMLQMHLLTEDDMKVFVMKSFKNNKSFIEQEQLNYAAANQLLTDIVQRANGVFLWISVVVQHSLALLSGGQSIAQVRASLEAVPTNISSMYDAMWVDIRPENLSDVSYMVQVLRAADGPLPWFQIWLINELKFSDINFNSLPNDTNWRAAVFKSLRRKLAAWTRCFLEVRGNERHGTVDFIHRTARDWATQPKNWQLICSRSDPRFDPHLGILKAEILILSNKSLREDFRISTARVLWHAGEVKDDADNRLDLVDYLNKFDVELRKMPQQDNDKWLAASSDGVYFLTRDAFPGIANTFLGIAAQFAVLPYIKSMTNSNRNLLSGTFSKGSFGLLESAIFGHTYYITPSPDFCRHISKERRLATVQYLLKQGVFQSKMHSPRGICNLKEEINKISHSDPDYYSKVVEYLNESQRGFGSKVVAYAQALLYRVLQNRLEVDKGNGQSLRQKTEKGIDQFISQISEDLKRVLSITTDTTDRTQNIMKKDMRSNGDSDLRPHVIAATLNADRHERVDEVRGWIFSISQVISILHSKTEFSATAEVRDDLSELHGKINRVVEAHDWDSELEETIPAIVSLVNKISEKYGFTDLQKSSERHMSYVEKEIETLNEMIGYIISTWSIRFSVGSNDFVQPENPIGSFLTVTGSPQDAFANTALSYVSWRWGRRGENILNWLSKFLLAAHSPQPNKSHTLRISGDGETACIELQGQLNHNSAMDLSEGNATISIKWIGGIMESYYALVAEVASQLAWTVAAFKEPPEGSISFTKVKIEDSSKIGRLSMNDGGPGANFSILHYEDPELRLAKESGTCWHQLFTGLNVAVGFPIPSRPDGMRGVELPFFLMTTFADIANTVEYKGGLILKGWQKALFPVRTESDSDLSSATSAIQWHLFSSERHRLYMAEAKKRNPNLVPVKTKLSQIEFSTVAWQEKRHFLGLYENSRIRIGTNESKNDEIAYVNYGSEMKRRYLRLPVEWNRGINFSIGAGGSGVQTGIRIPSKQERELKVKSEHTQHKIINATQRNSTILYDTTTRIAWMLPQICVVMHLVQAWVNENYTGAQIDYPTFNDVTARGLDTILERFWDQDAAKEANIDLKATFIYFAEALDQLQDYEDLEPAKRLHRSRLAGVDFAQLASQPRTFSTIALKIKTKSGGNWLKVLKSNWKDIETEDAPYRVVTLLCNNLSPQPILPSVHVCDTWFRLLLDRTT